MVLGCKKCDCSLVLKNTGLFTIKNTRAVNVILVNINGRQCNFFIFYFSLSLTKVLISVLCDIQCRVTICSPSPEELGYELNEPNTINL